MHGTEGLPAAYFGALSQSPPIAAALTNLGTQVRTGGQRGTYTDAERELMDIALAVEFGRKVLYSTERPSFSELEAHVKQSKSR